LFFDESATNAPFKEKEIVKEKEEGKEVDKVVERDVVDLAKFYVFFERLKDVPFSKAGVTLEQAMRNMNLAKENNLTLAGLLLFAINPQRYKPYCHIKAVNIDGTKTSDTTFLDRSDIEGTLRDQYDGAMLFLRKNLRRLQKGAEFNQSGNLEISEVALTEALVNALVHRDYTKNAPVRLMVFNDRVEIISPGSLPNHLTVENIKNGNTVSRNPIIVSYATKVLPYSGLGTGVSRILEFHSDTEFRDDKNGEQFTIILKRPAT
jgi:predicted HTH transcriptional regulator